jgi:hypothetical protein
MQLLAHILGLDDASGRWYSFWSGIFGDASILSVPAMAMRRHNCHVKRCPRLGRHPVAGTTWTVCRRHHPDGHPSAEDIQTKADAP